VPQAMDLWGGQLQKGAWKIVSKSEGKSNQTANRTKHVMYLFDIHLHIDLNRSDIWKRILKTPFQ